MTPNSPSRPAAVAFLGALVSLAALAGCACQVQVWANSDSDSPMDYTRTSPHHVHVGETTQFRITVDPDIASYVLVDFDGKLRLPNKIRPGQYSYSHYFGKGWPNRSAKINVRAYKQVGRRDYVRRGGRLIRRARSRDEPDEMIGASSMTIRCYQAKVIMKVRPPGGVTPNWRKAWLEITGPNGKGRRVRFGQSGRHGFTVLGPAVGGGYVVFYEPKHGEVRPVGRTKVVLRIPLPGGKEFRQEAWISSR